MTTSEREQRMAERILEDESLRGDLEDSAAKVLVDWASQRAAHAAADPAQPDDAVEAQVQQIRQAARAAARSGETEPRRLVALAEAGLSPAAAPSGDSAAIAASDKPSKEPTQADQPVAARAVGEQPMAAPPPVLPAPSPADAKQAPADTAAPKPAGSSGASRRRRRSRLARFLKHLRGER
ncbi:MAG TPA: hypothetical protein VFU22_09595 [Roseiflexaceae bacterium]|nr:hypothetical protein [Roseiflexaceae bacterium]